MNQKPDITSMLQNIGKALMAALSYRAYPVESVKQSIEDIETIQSNMSYLLDCEIYFRSTSSKDPLYYISNILYNLKTRNELNITPDELKWLGSVWKNFLVRSISYQNLFSTIDHYRVKFKSYYNYSGIFINQIDNVNLVKEEFIDTATPENAPLTKLENAHHSFSEVLSWMKPTYYFLLDYYYERVNRDSIDISEALQHESEGLANFGENKYTYYDITFLTCQSLGVLEAAYLILKKKKTSKRIINIDGKHHCNYLPALWGIVNHHYFRR